MKTKFWILIIMVFSLIFSAAITLAELLPEEKTIQLSPGENLVLIPEDISPFYVKDFTANYPEILTITYFEFQKEVGFANVFGGIGKNFIIYPNQEYNITVKTELRIKIK